MQQLASATLLWAGSRSATSVNWNMAALNGWYRAYYDITVVGQGKNQLEKQPTEFPKS